MDTLFGKILMLGCLYGLFAIGLCGGLRFVRQTLVDCWKRNRRVALVTLALGAILYGGSKTSDLVSKTSTDDGINLLSFKISESNEVVVVSGVTTTNYVCTIVSLKTEDGDDPYPIWFRDDTHQQWTNLYTVATWNTTNIVKDTTLSANGTNYYTWVSTDLTNNYSHTYWYIGTDLPAVDVETDTPITIDEFCVTSKKVHIKFHLPSGLTIPEGTVIEVLRSIGDTGEFTVLDEITAVESGTYVWNGFCVGTRTRWRLHCAITEED